jgi:hypothetical protein
MGRTPSTNARRGSSGQINDDAPTFQGMDAGPVPARNTTPVEVPPSYDPQWKSPTKRDRSGQSLHTPPSTPGSIFVEGPPILPTRTSSPGTISPPSEAPADLAAAPLSPPPDAPRRSTSAPRRGLPSVPPGE